MGRTLEESSSNEKNKLELEVYHEEDDYKVTKPSYKKLFKISNNLIEENDNIKKRDLELKEYLEFLEECNKMLKLEMVKIRNLVGTCETYAMQKEATNLRKYLSNFTTGT